MKPAPFFAAILTGIATAAAAPAAFAGDPIAMVNGRPLDKDRLVALLVEAHGITILQQLIVLDLAEQAAEARGFRVTEADVEREFQESLLRMLPADASTAKLSNEQRMEALKLLLAEKNLSLPEFRIGMRRNAALRTVVGAALPITEETIREQYARMYGEKVEIRHIQVPVADNATLNKVVGDLAAGTDFVALVRAHSVNAESQARDGLLEPFTFRDEAIPAALREAAFGLPIGATSSGPIRAERFYHIIRVERRIPADTAYEAVKDEVASKLRFDTEQRAMKQLLNELVDKAQVRVLDPKLRAEYEEIMKKRAMTGKDPTLP